MYFCYLKCYLVFIVNTLLFYYQGALVVSKTTKSYIVKLFHSAIERKGIWFHSSVKIQGRVCTIFYIPSKHTLPYLLIVFHRSGMSGSSLLFKRTGLLGCMLGTLIRQRRSPESYKCNLSFSLLTPFYGIFNA